VLQKEGKNNLALDSSKKAFELGKLIYRRDDYNLFELQINLAEAYKAADEDDQAESIFNECFQMMDGRDGTSNYSRGMSIKSKLSRNLSIKSRVNTLVRYGG
jgi:hypothetical protein